MRGEEIETIAGSQSVVRDNRKGYVCLKCGREIGKKEIKVAVSPIEFPEFAQPRRRVVCAECFRKSAVAYAKHVSPARARRHVADAKAHMPRLSSVNLAYN